MSIKNISAVLIFCAFVAACTPVHNVKPLPNFVETAFEPGDTVLVTTRDGTESEFIVTEIQDETIYGDNHAVPLQQIVKLQKKAWKRPESPCGGEKPLGCSVPLVIQLSSEIHSHYESEFYDACAQHDYCYRHGYQTYDLDRESCDEEFLGNMLATCPAPPVAITSRILEVLDDSFSSRTNCVLMAEQFYEAVRRFGEKNFLTQKSTMCEYNGPAPGTQ